MLSPNRLSYIVVMVPVEKGACTISKAFVMQGDKPGVRFFHVLAPCKLSLDAAELSKILTDYSFAVDIVNIMVRIVLINAAGAAKAEKVKLKTFCDNT